MKTLNRYLFLGMFLVLAAVGCGKKKSNPAVNATVPASNYIMQNGQCYLNGEAVAATYCNQTQVGQPGYVPPVYGQPGYYNQYPNAGYSDVNAYHGYPTYGYPGYGSGYGGGGISIGGSINIGIGGGGYSQQCYGYYYTQSGQSGYCNGANCSGYTLYQSGQAVYCR